MGPTAGNHVVTDPGLVGSTDFHSSHPHGHDLSGRGSVTTEDAQGTPTPEAYTTKYTSVRR